MFRLQQLEKKSPCCVIRKKIILGYVGDVLLPKRRKSLIKFRSHTKNRSKLFTSRIARGRICCSIVFLVQLLLIVSHNKNIYWYTLRVQKAKCDLSHYFCLHRNAHSSKEIKFNAQIKCLDSITIFLCVVCLYIKVARITSNSCHPPHQASLKKKKHLFLPPSEESSY